MLIAMDLCTCHFLTSLVMYSIFVLAIEVHDGVAVHETMGYVADLMPPLSRPAYLLDLTENSVTL